MDHAIHQALTEIVHESHPEVASKLTPDQWQQLLSALMAIIPIVVQIFIKTPVPAPTPVPPPVPGH